ncbi:hypothetical protein VHEMI08923 [[Torrubiella] hemipterigena]|uniref:Uncharacterized protein n=1 Tax=[Torrubiella] hemipterigena TaxID=1531966 RepID=A0A0A1TP38_9HYPO|nr:hypothetical protein VHEMI08923 [[Torrubiella] hemipterigena]
MKWVSVTSLAFLASAIGGVTAAPVAVTNQAVARSDGINVRSQEQTDNLGGGNSNRAFVSRSGEHTDNLGGSNSW